MPAAPSRRSLLKGIGHLGVLGSLAGCTQGGDGGGGETTTTTTTTSTTTTTTTTTDEEMDTDETTTTTTTTTETDDVTSTVAMVDSSFSPLKLDVPTGTTVTWTNQDSFAHTVVATRFHSNAEQWSFASGEVQSGQSVTYTFENEGIYEYYCDVHGKSSMCGAILVGGATLSKELPCAGGGYY